MAFEKPTDEQLGNRFYHHPPIRDQAQRYEQVRRHILATAKVCVAITPCSPEHTGAQCAR